MKQYSFLKKIIAPAFLSGIIILIGGSCKKELHTAPIGSTYGDEFWTSQNAVEEAVAAMYGQLRVSLRAASDEGVDDEVPCYFVFGDFVSNLFSASGNDVFLQYGLTSTNTKPWNFSYVPYWSKLQNWSRFYQVIALCNLVLQNVPQMPVTDFESKEQQDAYVAQALFVRAYTYFTITRIWGDPVYVSKTYNDVDYGNIPPVPRSPESDVLDSCIRDLHVAASALDFSGGNPFKSITANKGTVDALLAHIFEWKHEYDSAHFYCQEVINKGGYALEPMSNYLNIWKGQSSGESIFEIAMQYNSNDPQFKASDNSWAEASFNCFAGFLKGPIVNNIRTSCWIAPYGPDATGNPFPSTIIFSDTTNDARTHVAMRYTISSNGDATGFMLLKYTNFAYQSPGNETYPYINNNLVLIRLADIYLLDAEALAYKGDLEGARNELRFTEDRAGLTTYTQLNNPEEMVEEIIKERGRELIGEGQWYFDLVRNLNTQNSAHNHWLTDINYQPQRLTPQSKGYYWPIDMKALFPYDNLLVQNPWWTNNSGN